MSLAFTRLSPTPIVQTLHHSPSAARSRCGRAIPEAPFVAISNEQARLLAGLNVVGTVLHGIDTDALHVPRDARRLPAVPRPLHRGQGRAAGDRGRQARRHAAAARRRRERVLPRDVAPHVDGTRSSTSARPTSPTKVKLYGGARALLYPVQAREPFGLVLAEAMACGTPVAALDRGAVREVVDDGVTGIVFDDLDQMVAGLPRVLALDRRRVRERAVERFGVERMVDEYVDRLPPDRGGRIVDDAQTESTALRRPHDPRGLRASRRRVAGVRRHAGASGRRRRPRRAAVRVARRARRSATDPARRDGDLGRVRVRRTARGGADARDRRGAHLRSSRRRPALGRRRRAARRDRRGHRTLRPDGVITFAEDGLYWHLDHIGVHERTITAVRSLGAEAPPLYYVTMPQGVMRAVVEAGAEGLSAAARGKFWGIEPDAFGEAAEPRPSSSTSATGSRGSSRRSAATARRWARPSVRADRRSRGQTAARARTFPSRADREPLGIGPRTDGRAGAHRMNTATLDILRCPFCGGRLELVTSSFHRTSGDEIHDGILGCQCCIFPVVDGIPVLHLQPAAIAAREHDRGRAAGLARCARCSASTTRARPSDSTRLAASEHRHVPRASSRRSGDTSRAAISCTASRIPTYVVGHAVVRAVARHGAARRRPRDRHLRRLGAPDPGAHGPVVAGAGARRPVLREDLAGAPLHRARLRGRSAATATRRCRSRAARSGSRCARTRSCTSGRSVSSSLDMLRARRQRRCQERRAHQPHAQPVHVEPVARPAADAGRLPRSVRDARGRGSSARPGCSPTSSPAARSICRAWTTSATLDADPALTIIATRQPGVFARHPLEPPPAAGRWRVPRQPALRRTGAPDGADTLQFPPAVSLRRLRGGVRRLPAVPARGSRRSTAALSRAIAAGRVARRARRPGAPPRHRRPAEAVLLRASESDPRTLNRRYVI